MLVFIIPLKSPQVSNSWEHVSKLFERCLRSVCNQTSSQFRVLVVCNQKPEIEFKHPYVTYIEVDFPTPEHNSKARMRDKRMKVLVGLFHAQKLNPSHTMVVDADDCVSKHLAEFVSQHPQSNGWFVNRGFLYKNGSKFLYFRRKDFYQWCGTCTILKYDLFDLPERIDYHSLKTQITTKKYYYIHHSKVVEEMVEEGKPIKSLPFPGAVYIVCHGDNDASFKNVMMPVQMLARIKKILLNYRFLTKSIQDEFSLYSL